MLAQLVERCSGIAEVKGSNLVQAWIFSGFLFPTTKVASITAMIFFHIILHPAVLIYDFHIFITSSSSFQGFNTNQFNELLPVGLLAQLVERCTVIAEVEGSNPVQAWTFSGFFRKCKNCVYNCDDLLSYNGCTCKIFSKLNPYFCTSNKTHVNFQSVTQTNSQGSRAENNTYVQILKMQNIFFRNEVWCWNFLV